MLLFTQRPCLCTKPGKETMLGSMYLATHAHTIGEDMAGNQNPSSQIMKMDYSKNYRGAPL